MFLLGFFVGIVLEFINWFYIAPLISMRKRDKVLSYLPYDKYCKEAFDCYKTCYEVNCALHDLDEHQNK